MKKPVYILRAGTLRRYQNTLLYETQEGKKIIPVESVKELHILGEATISTRVINFLLQKGIPLHFYNFYGIYTGTLFPRSQNISGLVVLKQAEHYLDLSKRLKLAISMVEGSIFNMLRILKYYHNRGRPLSSHISSIENIQVELQSANDIQQVRGYEGKARDIYYSAWNEIITVDSHHFKFTTRERKPPSNPVNALISFGNGLLYATIVSELHAVHLHGGISFVHEPGSYRFSLALDIADIFKPILVDRLIFNLINHRILDESNFEYASNYSYLKESGRRIFIQKWQEQIEKTVKHLTLKRKVSYRTLIKLECYKLIKHFIGEKEYKPFKMWW